MVLDAILLAVAQVCARSQPEIRVGILPEFQVATDYGVTIRNPETKFRTFLTGSVDYGVCTYETQSDRNSMFGNNVVEVASHSTGLITLGLANRSGGSTCWECMPEAVGQAAALSEATGKPAVRYCMSDGETWIFSLFTKDANGKRVSHGGWGHQIRTPTAGSQTPFPSPGNEAIEFKAEVLQVVTLMHHWLVSGDDPLNDRLYTLPDTFGRC